MAFIWKDSENTKSCHDSQPITSGLKAAYSLDYAVSCGQEILRFYLLKPMIDEHVQKSH
jgi:hypothetical protein